MMVEVKVENQLRLLKFDLKFWGEIMNRFLYDEIILTKDEVRFCNKCLDKIVLTEDDTLIWSASFGNGFEMDIKLCGADEEVAWTEAVLFKDGCELACTDCMDTILGEWEIDYDDVAYITYVIEEN